MIGQILDSLGVLVVLGTIAWIFAMSVYTLVNLYNRRRARKASGVFTTPVSGKYEVGGSVTETPIPVHIHVDTTMPEYGTNDGKGPRLPQKNAVAELRKRYFERRSEAAGLCAKGAPLGIQCLRNPTHYGSCLIGPANLHQLGKVLRASIDYGKLNSRMLLSPEGVVFIKKHLREAKRRAKVKGDIKRRKSK